MLRICAFDNYVIGVKNNCPKARLLYSSMVCNMGKHPKFEIIKKRSINVATEVNEGLKERDIETNYDSITIDHEAKLAMYKQKNTLIRPYVVIDAGDWMMYPFRNYMGIIMPNSIVSEDEKKIVFDCHIVDPVADFKMFKAVTFGKN